MQRSTSFLFIAVCLSCLGAKANGVDVIPVLQDAHELRVSCAAVSNSRTLVATGASDRKIMVWDTAARAKVAEIGPLDDSINALAFSSDETRLYSATESKITEWDIASGKRLGQKTAHYSGKYKYVAELAAFPKSTRLVSGGWNGEAVIWQCSSWIQVARLRGHEGFVDAVAVAPDESYVVTATHRSAEDVSWVRIWQADTGKLVKKVVVKARVLTLRFTTPQQLMLGCHDGGVWGLAVSDFRLTRLFKVSGPVRAIDSEARGNLLAIGCAKGEISTWGKIGSGWKRKVRIMERDGEAVAAVFLTANDRELFTPSGRGGIQFLETDSGSLLRAFAPAQGFVKSVDMTPDGKRMVLSRHDEPYVYGKNVGKSLLIWDLGNCKKLQELSVPGFMLGDVSLSSAGQRAAVAASDMVKVIDVQTGKDVRQLKASRGSVWSVDLSKNGGVLVYGTRSGLVGRVSLAGDDKIEKKAGRTIGAVALLKNGNLLTADYDSNNIRELSSIKLEPRADAEFRLKSRSPRSLCLSDREQTVAIGTVNDGAVVYDWPSRRELSKFAAPHEYSSCGDAFLLKDSCLGIFRENEAVDIYDVTTRKLVLRIKFFEAGRTWVSVAAGGRFSGPMSASKWIRFRNPDSLELLPLSDTERFRTPNLIGEVLQSH